MIGSANACGQRRWQTFRTHQYRAQCEGPALQVNFGGEILAHTDAPPVKKTSRTLTYGPYGDIAASFANYWLKFHAVNNAPFAVARSVSREIEVSHWGNIYVEERYLVVSKPSAQTCLCAVLMVSRAACVTSSPLSWTSVVRDACTCKSQHLAVDCHTAHMAARTAYMASEHTLCRGGRRITARS